MTPMTPTISVIVPIYNGERYLRRAVRSLLDTGYPALEIVLVDDGSRDQSWPLAQQLAAGEPRIAALRHPGGRNLGVSATRNRGIEHSTGELVSFLDVDDYVLPHRYESAVAILLAQPDVDGVHQLAAVEFEDDEARRGWEPMSTTFGFSRDIEPEDLIWQLLRGYSWHTSAIVIRKALLDQTGTFPLGVKVAEDCDLWFRLAHAGRLVSGDLKRPVSIYWRRANSAYRPSHETRIHMIRAMRSFLHWLDTRARNPSVLAHVREAIFDYTVRGISGARERRDALLARRLSMRSLALLPGLIWYRRFLAEATRVALGTPSKARVRIGGTP